MAARHALPVSLLLLSLHIYWFGVADRYRVFLYFHDMGPLVPDTAPFSAETSSRYWMAGLVANGILFVLYTFYCWLQRWITVVAVPSPWRLWLACALPLMFGIPLITATLNEPTLPIRNTLQVTLATVAGLLLALAAAELALRPLTDQLWTFVTGWVIMPLLVVGAQAGQLAFWVQRGRTFYVGIFVATIVASLLLLLGVSILYIRRHGQPLSLLPVLIAAFCASYLLLPLIHHLGFTDGYYYISSSTNFVADSLLGQLLAWALSISAVWVIFTAANRVAQTGTPASQRL